jgi:hypothetical protein
MKKLCVAGCSVSDYTDVESPYGQLIAANLGLEYLHEGAGAGSNYRIWRRITNHVLDGNITPDDILIVQYTEIVRNEFWSALPQPDPNWYRAPPADTSHDNGRILRWKFGSHVWQPYEEEQHFFEEYEKYFVSPRFAQEQFRVNNYNFQMMLKYHNIKTIFLTTSRSTVAGEYLIEPFHSYQVYDKSNGDPVYNLRENDSCHFSQLGHRVMADKLIERIKELQWA